MDQFNRMMDMNKNLFLDQEPNNMHISPENANRTIFLADLPKGTSYLEISDYYEQHAKVSGFNISIKRPLFKHFYFAFVQFQKLEDAQKVLSEHRFPVIKGHKTRALAFHMANSYMTASSARDRKNASEEDSQIFVKNCPKEWTHEDLYKHFEALGEINSAKVSIDADFKSRGFGFIEFKEAKFAVKAIAEFNEQEVACEADLNSGQSHKVLTVSKYEQKRARSTSGEVPLINNLYVKNFPRKQEKPLDDQAADGEAAPIVSSGEIDDSFTDADLAKLFEEFGEIVSAAVMKHEDGRSKGFGFVCFKNGIDAKKALDFYKNREDQDASDGTDRLYVAEAKSKEARRDEVLKKTYRFKLSMMYLNLIVKNIDPTVHEDEIMEHFSQFGNVQNVKLEQKNVDSSVAFVSFFDRESAHKAKTGSDKIPFKNRPIFVAFCEPRELRHLKMEEKIDQKMYQKQQMQNFTSKHSELLQLVSSIGLLFQNQQNMNLMQRRSHSGNMPMNRNGPYTQNLNVQGTGMNNQRRPNQNYQRRYNNGQNYQGRSMSGQPPMQMQMNQQNMQMQQPMTNYPLGNQMQQQQMIQQPKVHPEQQKMMDYQQDIANMFNSPEFQNGTSQMRRDVIGTKLYNYIVELVGADNAPKVTGMIIDLDPAELNISIQTFQGLHSKVKSAMELLIQNNLATPAPQLQMGQMQQDQVLQQPQVQPVVQV